MGLAIDTFVALSSRAKSDYVVAGFDIVATEKAIGPAIVQISNEEDDVALRLELASTPPTDVCDKGFPGRLKEVF